MRLILVAVFALSTLALQCAFAGETPPNVVMIVADDQGWEDYGFMGHPHIRTPNIDRLAREGLVFRRGYVPSSLCRASLATMITGLYPHQHGVTSNDPPLPPGQNLSQAMRNPEFVKQRNRMADKIAQSDTIPKVLGKAGYISMQTGKWWETDSCRCGFSEGMTHGDTARGGRHGDEGLKIGREGVEAAVGFMNRAAESRRPFFLWYAPMMPHQPHNPPDRILAHYRTEADSAFIARYWAMCEWFDETIGEILRHLDRRDLSRNTIVVFLSDNGWIQNPESEGYAPRSKRSPYDGGIRTPIILRWPARIKPAENPSLAASVDLAPTILRAAGIRALPSLPGINLFNSHELRRRKSIFGAIFTHNAVDIDNPAANVQYRWIISGGMKLIARGPESPKGAEVELFDVTADPLEKSNLARTESGTVERLKKRLDQWWPAAVIE